MQTLIVLEDMYGIADIYKAIMHIGIEDTQDITVVNSQVDIVSGCNNVCSISLRGRTLKGLSNYDVIVSVFDIDKLGKGSRNTVMQTEDFLALDKMAVGEFKHLYLPIVYNSETIMLYQYLYGNSNLDVVDIVNAYDTYEFQEKLLKEIIELCNKGSLSKNVKRVKDYLDIDKLRYGLAYGKKGKNRYFKDWIINSCSMDVNLFATTSDVVRLLEVEQSDLKMQLDMNRLSYRVGQDYIIDLTALGKNKHALVRC